MRENFTFLGIVAPFLCGLFFAPSAHCQEATVHTFCTETRCADGAFPEYGSLIIDAAGNLYGTTAGGGSYGGPYHGRRFGCGTVFRLAPDGTEAVLHAFSHEADGCKPYGGVIMDASGNLYGTTAYGTGSGWQCAPACGTVFEITPDGRETVLHAFQGSDGANPFAGLVLDNVGNLYGTTQYGGSAGYGTVFKVGPDGTESVLYSFTGRPDGAYPDSPLFMGSSGNLYGTTAEGGLRNAGTVFRVGPHGVETRLHSFCRERGCADGIDPEGSLIMGPSGNLYGTANRGGANNAGVIFRLSRDRTETVLHNFCFRQNCIDGVRPSGSLIMDSSGNLYGTTWGGGQKHRGAVYELSASGRERVLHSFTGKPYYINRRAPDGARPLSGLVADGKGNLYGMTWHGGSGGHRGGAGIVFVVNTSSARTNDH